MISLVKGEVEGPLGIDVYRGKIRVKRVRFCYLVQVGITVVLDRFRNVKMLR